MRLRIFTYATCTQSQTTESHLLLPTIERGEDIFGQLENFKNEYNEWVLPAQVGFQIEYALWRHHKQGS